MRQDKLTKLGFECHACGNQEIDFDKVEVVVDYSGCWYEGDNPEYHLAFNCPKCLHYHDVYLSNYKTKYRGGFSYSV